MAQNIIEYKEFIGSVNFSDADECFFGKIEVSMTWLLLKEVL